MKARVIVLIFFCGMPLDTSTKTRFVSPSLLTRFIYWIGQGSIPDVAKFLIKYSYDLSLVGAYIVDYGSEAVYAGFTRGPGKIPHELVKYVCAQKISAYANAGIDFCAFDYPLAFKKNKYLYKSLLLMRPFLVKCAIRCGIDYLVDLFMQETDEEDEIE